MRHRLQPNPVTYVSFPLCGAPDKLQPKQKKKWKSEKRPHNLEQFEKGPRPGDPL